MKTTKFVAFAGVVYLFFCLSAVALPTETMNVIYINGIQNTLPEAEETAEKIRSILETSPYYIGDQRKSFKIHTVWNPKGFYYEKGVDDINPFRDLQELFILKTAEEHYYQDFLSIMSPFDMSMPLDQQAAQRVKVYLKDMLPGDNYFELIGAVTDAKMADTQTAVYKLAARIKNLQPVVVVAHSEGNLLANLAYASLVSVYGDETKNMVRIINVANTSAFSVNNLNFTHSVDNAIADLKSLPLIGYWPRKTPKCDVSDGLCPFEVADPTFGVPDIDFGVPDVVLHSMEEVYLSSTSVSVLDDQGINFTSGTSFQDHFVDIVYAAANSFNSSNNSSNTCGAYIAPGVWKEFDCYNLAAIGKTTNDDPFTPSWRLIGGYWQWGRKGPDESQWYDTNTSNFAHGPTGPDEDDANDGRIDGWDISSADDGAWSDDEKTSNDPCPSGYRVPTQSQLDGIYKNNARSIVGTWSSDDTLYSSGRFFGDDLMLPTTGKRCMYSGEVVYSGHIDNYWSSGNYWSSTEDSGDSSHAWHLLSSSSSAGALYLDHRSYGFSVRCIAE